MLYKRSKKAGSHWWTRFTIDGRETRVSCGTARKALAEEFERKLRDAIWRETTLGEVLHTWEEAKEKWLADKKAKRSLQRDMDAFVLLDPVLCGLALSDIDETVLLKCEEHLTPGRKRSTVIRMLAVLRAVLRRAAKKWKWITVAPEFALEKLPQPPIEWLTQERFEILWRELPDHARQIVRFAVAVGPRSGNIFRLRWADVDLHAKVFRVAASEFKGQRDVGFPLPEDALVVLEQQRGRHPEYVFTDQRGRAPIGSIKTCWRKARARAGMPKLRVHDLRHTWAAWHKLASTPDRAIKELGGWSDIRMVERYGHINPQDYVEFVDNRRSKSGTGSAKK